MDTTNKCKLFPIHKSFVFVLLWNSYIREQKFKYREKKQHL
jgi:hypothetical protein